MSKLYLGSRLISPILATTGDKTFVFEQAIPSASWVITHNLNKFPSVSVVDSGGNEVICDVKYDSINQITLTMSAAFAGKAYLN